MFVADPSEVAIRRKEARTTEIILYGTPTRTYRLETTTSLNEPIDRQNGPTRTMTNSFFIVPSTATTNDARFHRARQLWPGCRPASLQGQFFQVEMIPRRRQEAFASLGGLREISFNDRTQAHTPRNCEIIRGRDGTASAAESGDQAESRASLEARGSFPVPRRSPEPYQEKPNNLAYPMKKLLVSLSCLVVLFTNAARADDLPFFSTLREEIVNQLTIASNNLALNKKLISTLASNRKTLDKTKPTLVTGSDALGTLARALAKTSLSNTFLPIVTGIRTVYLETMDDKMEELEERLSHTIPGKAQTTAQTDLGKATIAIDAVGTNSNFALSLKALSKAATALAKAEKSVAKAETAKPGANFLTATITESNQGVTLLNSTKTFLDAYYDPIFGEIDIEAADLKKLGGGPVQLRGLSLAAIVPGEGTHTLSLTNESNAYYQRIIAPNIREFEEEEPDFDFQELYLTVDPFNQRLGTGTLTITLDLDANIVWGIFTLTATGSENSDLAVSMTGSFLIRLTTFDDFE